MPNKTARKGLYTNVLQKQAWLSDSFGVELALKKLNLTNEKLESIVGRYTRGQRKGQLRGQLVWFKVEAGGWVHGIGVIGPCSFGYAIADYNGAFLYPKVDFPDTWSDEHIISFFYQEEIKNKNQSNLDVALRRRNITIQNPEILCKYIANRGIIAYDDAAITEILTEDNETTKQKTWGECDKIFGKIVGKLLCLGFYRSDTPTPNEKIKATFDIFFEELSDMKNCSTTKKEEVDDFVQKLESFASEYRIL